MHKFSFALSLLILLPLNDSMAQSTAHPYDAKWPAGWEVTETPGPRPYSEKDLGGITIKVMKKDEGKMAACIALMYFPRSDKGQANIQEEFDIMQSTVKKEYQAKGLEVTATPAKTTTLGSLPALENEITVPGKNFVLRQWSGLAMSKQYFYQLSYSGLTSNFDKYRTQFEECRRSLTLK